MAFVRGGIIASTTEKKSIKDVFSADIRESFTDETGHAGCALPRKEAITIYNSSASAFMLVTGVLSLF